MYDSTLHNCNNRSNAPRCYLPRADTACCRCIGDSLSPSCRLTSQAATAIPGVSQDLDEHEDLGTAVVWAAIALTLIRTHLVHRKQFTETTRVVYLLFALGVAGLVYASGYTGGHLVYKYGAGTQPVLDTLE